LGLRYLLYHREADPIVPEVLMCVCRILRPLYP